MCSEQLLLHDDRLIDLPACASVHQEPLVMLHGTTGMADAFFNQLISLGAKGYRIIAVRAHHCPCHARSF